jgi:ABC-type uncharacterized transport system ATPase subunit
VDVPPAIEVRELRKAYVVSKLEAGLREALKGLVRRRRRG